MKLKEVKAKAEDSGSKARQYLDGLLKIPFSVYKREPILNIMEQIYQSGHSGEFKLYPIEFNEKGVHLFTLILDELKGELDAVQQIIPHFTRKTGNVEYISPLSKIYIDINYKKNPKGEFILQQGSLIPDGYSIINNQKPKGELQIIKTPSLNKQLPYSTLISRLNDVLEKGEQQYDGQSFQHEREKKLSYPVLFYFLIFTFKKFLNTRQGKLAGTQCHLPKMFQA
jgi:hypothetical protein